jgi:hypothetical protein
MDIFTILIKAKYLLPTWVDMHPLLTFDSSGIIMIQLVFLVEHRILVCKSGFRFFFKYFLVKVY